MKSPFPGMDPYLEDPAFWPEFHSKFVNCWQEHLADLLPDHYEARLGVNIYLVEDVLETKKQAGPDVTVVRTRRRKSSSGRMSGATATLAPVSIPLLVMEERKQAFIKLIHRPTRDVVAVLELLSPANKKAPNRREYLAKRNALLRQCTHVVELDLLLSGQRLELAEPLPEGDYYYLVSRGDQRPRCDVYAWTMADPLPAVPVPLLAPDADITCDLETVFQTTYERGRYWKAVDYRKAPPVTLTKSRKQWVQQRVRA